MKIMKALNLKKITKAIKNWICGNYEADIQYLSDELKECEETKDVLYTINRKLNKKVERYLKEIQRLKELLNQSDAPKPPTINEMKIVSNLDISNLFHKLNILPQAVVELSDRFYYTCGIDRIKEFLKYDKTNYKPYQSDIFDCDDFSLVLDGRVNLWQPALPFGVAWSSTHAFNIFIDDKNQVWIIEPQTDVVMSLEQAKKKVEYYPIKFIMI